LTEKQRGGEREIRIQCCLSGNEANMKEVEKVDIIFDIIAFAVGDGKGEKKSKRRRRQTGAGLVRLFG